MQLHLRGQGGTKIVFTEDEQTAVDSHLVKDRAGEGKESTMTRTKKSTARRHEPSSERLQPQKAQTQTTDDELEKRMQSALEDVYEVLLIADESNGESGWSGLELVNDLIH